MRSPRTLRVIKNCLPAVPSRDRWNKIWGNRFIIRFSHWNSIWIPHQCPEGVLVLLSTTRALSIFCPPQGLNQGPSASHRSTSELSPPSGLLGIRVKLAEGIQKHYLSPRSIYNVKLIKIKGSPLQIDDQDRPRTLDAPLKPVKWKKS